MGRAASSTYDPSTGNWSFSTKEEQTTTSGDDSGSAKKTPTQTGTPTSGGESNLKASDTDKDQSAGATDKKYNAIELNTLEGDLVFIVTEETIKLKAGDTVRLEGLGKYLSGNYYVRSIERNISADGYSHSAVVIRTDFGDKLKSSGTKESKGDSQDQGQTEKTQSTPAATTTPQRTYTVKKGDCLWNIAKQEYGSGTSWKKIYDANTGQIVNPNLIYPGQKLVIP